MGVLLALLAQVAAPPPPAVPDPLTLGPYNPIVIGMIGTQICLIIAAIVQGILSVLAHGERKDVAIKVDTVARDTEAIKGHVNSEKTAAEGRENALRQENMLLREIIADKKATAGLLAQAVASRAHVVVAGDGLPPVAATAPAVVESLAQIESNTATIADNTAPKDDGPR